MIDPPPPPPSQKVKVFDSTMLVSGLALMVILFAWVTWIGPWLAKKNAPPPPPPALNAPILQSSTTPAGTPAVKPAGPVATPQPTAPVTPGVPAVGPVRPADVGAPTGPAVPVPPVAAPAQPAGTTADPAAEVGPTAPRRLITVNSQNGRVQAVVSTAGGALRSYDIAEPRPLPGDDPRITLLDALQRAPDRMSLAIRQIDYKLNANEAWTAIPDFDQRIYRVVPANGQDIDALSGYLNRPAQIVTLETQTALFTLTRKFIFFEEFNQETPHHIDSEITFTPAPGVSQLWIRYTLRGAAGILPDGPKEQPVSQYNMGMGRAFSLVSNRQGESTLRKLTQDELITMINEKNQGNLTSGELNLWTGIQNRFFSAILVPYEPQQDPTHADRIFVFYADPIRKEWLYHDPANPRYGGGTNGSVPILETEVGVIRDHGLAAATPQTDRYALYLGPSSYPILKDYDRRLSSRPTGLALNQTLELDRNIEYSSFGWLDYLSRGLVWFLGGLHFVTGSFGLSVILLTILVKLAMFPVSRNMVVSGEKQKLLAPYLVALKKLNEGKDDTASKTKMQQEMMALYSMNKASPFSSCLPMLVTIPVFLALYNSFWANYDMRHMGFMGFIKDLCEPDRVFPIYLDQIWSMLPHWFNLLPCLYLGLTYVQMSMTPQPPSSDPTATQMKFMTKLMPLMMFVFFYNMPSGLVLYFTASSLYSIIETKLIRRFFYKPVPVEAPAHLKKMVEKMAAEQQATAQATGLGLAARS